MNTIKKTASILLLISGSFRSAAQTESVKPALFDGILIAGYVNNGAFLNFGGPNLNLTKNNSKLILGMFPSIRFKEDKGATKNSFITPALGIGLTYLYKNLAFQLPLYYNQKTGAKNGEWHIGIGLGLRITGAGKKGK